MKDILFEKFMETLGKKTGLNIRTPDRDAVAKMVLSRARKNRLSSPEEYLQLISVDTGLSRAELRIFKGLLTSGESYFFRDKGQFDLLASRVLPEIIEKRKREKTLKVWSAGCATGEEPYSIAILLDGLMQGRPGWDIRILGTDIREDFLQTAEKGLYKDWSFRGVDAGTRRKYFLRRDNQWEIDGRIKKMVSFQPFDLTTDECQSGDIHDMDLIICRNVFIYYNRATTASVVGRLARSLAEGGFFMTGHAELFSIASGLLKPRLFPESVVYERQTDKEAEGLLLRVPQVAGMAMPGTEGICRQMPARMPEDAGKVLLKSTLAEAEGFFKKGLYREAAERVAPLLKDSPNVFSALFICAEALANIGDTAGARAHLNKAIELNPLAIEPYYLLSRIAMEEGDRVSAKEALKKAVYLDPCFVAGYMELAVMHEADGDNNKAKKTRQAAMDALKAMPKDKMIPPYENATAGSIIEHLERMILTPEDPTA